LRYGTHGRDLSSLQDKESPIGTDRNSKTLCSALEILVKPGGAENKGRLGEYLIVMEIEPFVDAQAASEFLNLRPRRILELARRGILPAYPVGEGRRRVWRFRLSELAASIRDRAVNSPRQSPAPSQEKI